MAEDRCYWLSQMELRKVGEPKDGCGMSGASEKKGRGGKAKAARGLAPVGGTRCHRFFLNRYEGAAFTKCPKCEGKTKVRKFPLVVHIEPSQLLVLNKQGRYCEGCDLIIARRSEVESLMAAAFERRDPAIVGNEYLVVGTLPRRPWRARDDAGMRPVDMLDQTEIFRDVWKFELVGGGWGPAAR